MTTFDYTKVSEAKNGFTIERAAGFFSGEDSPVGNQAPVSSIYLRTSNGDIWRKIGAGENDWQKHANIVHRTHVPISLDTRLFNFEGTGLTVIDDGNFQTTINYQPEGTLSGGNILVHTFVFVGQLGNAWLGNMHPSISSDESPLVMPYEGTIIGVGFGNVQLCCTHNSD